MDLIELRSRQPGDVNMPISGALGIPLIYMVSGAAYILISGLLAETYAENAHQLALIESAKGLVFVLVTGALLFVLCVLWMRQLHRQTRLLLQQERRAMAGMASASIAHDLNNLLTVLYGLLDELKEHETSNDLLAKLNGHLEATIHQLGELSKGLISSARQLDTSEIKTVELSARLRFIIKLISRHPDVSSCTLKAEDLCVVHLRINSALFEQAAMNLIINAAQAAGPGGTVEISLRKSGDAVILQVDDNGPGLSEYARGQMFSPGYTTKQHGSGLGLLSVRAFAESCGGEVCAVPARLGGTAFMIKIPETPDSVHSAPTGGAPEQP